MNAKLESRLLHGLCTSVLKHALANVVKGNLMSYKLCKSILVTPTEIESVTLLQHDLTSPRISQNTMSIEFPFKFNDEYYSMYAVYEM